ncbi:N-acetylmuramoyl-L-alanine amidase [Leptolyngbya sp. AN02str]|uniref:N-acetylmuramoyl-L-alanine amidase n=1 Tax=Leptolyngbya sp. AN02str TaxID=3423363 RepID=UPI003D31DF7A
MVSAVSSQTIFVNPNGGNDNASGTQAQPYKTITRALRRTTAGSTIRLAYGTYSAASGEVFPLVVPSGVEILGDENTKGQNLVIDGGGELMSAVFARQVATLRLETGAQLRGVTVSNRQERGTGAWVESTAPTIAHCTFVNCGREGVMTTGTATPEILDCVFDRNAASGISLTRNSKGEVRRNTFRQTGYGIAISDNASPLLADNRITDSRCGIVVSGSARPVLRNNLAERNTEDGLLLLNTAVPDVGRPQDPGGNVFQQNTGSDVRNLSNTPLISVGNQINPVRVNVGAPATAKPVEFAASTVVSQIQTVVSRPAPVPTPIPAPAPTPVPAPAPSAEAAKVNLSDIAGHWAEPFIRELVARGVLTGYGDGTFKPEVPINRAQYAALLAKAFDLPPRRGNTGFVDVPSNFWAAAAIAKAESMGFLSGFPDGTFRPMQNLTRVQTIVSLVSGLELLGGNPEFLSVYRDRAEIPTYATIPLAAATQKRIVVNHPDVDRFEPMVDITRAEIAAIIYQTLVVTGQARAIASPYIVVPNPLSVSFADVQNHWALDFVRGLASQGLVSGFADGKFMPDGPMTRAQYSALLVNTFNPLPKRAGMEFSDVPASHWAAGAIQRVYRGRLLSGGSDGLFRPDKNILRIEVLLSLVNGLELPPGDLALINRYQDLSAITNPALQAAIASATANYLVVNYPNLAQLNPMRDATRAEVSAMVYQALVQAGRSPAIASSYIVDPKQNPGNGGTPPDPVPQNPLVVIDPGHGGNDPGAIGINGLRETDVVLAIALEAAAVLRNYNIRVVMTRDTEKTVSLEERVAIAETVKANAFVSIHANSVGLSRPEINGLETFHYPGSLEGAKLSSAVHNSLVQAVKPIDRGVKQANFFVIRNTTMPATLVETGFITGVRDAANLANPAYQTALGRAIALGIFQYVKKPVG